MRVLNIVTSFFICSFQIAFAQSNTYNLNISLSKVIPMNMDEIPEKDGVLNIKYLGIEITNISHSLYEKGDTIVLAAVDKGVLIFNKLHVLTEDFPQNNTIYLDSIIYKGHHYVSDNENSILWKGCLRDEYDSVFSRPTCYYLKVKVNSDDLVKMINDELDFSDELELKNFEFTQLYSNGVISFDCQSLKSHFLSWSITDNMGKEVLQGQIEIYSGKSDYKINVGGLKMGRYTFTLGTGSESINENFTVFN